MPKSSAPKIAACAFELKRSTEGVHVLPDGEFRTADGSGRPTECAAWRMGPDIAARVIRLAALKPRDTVIDYEHSLLIAKEKGGEAPAAGWWKNGLVYQPGKGLIATGVQWTERAAAMIDAGEYRYVSPVFSYADNGDVLALLHFSLTNDPALAGLDDLALAALSAQLSTPTESPMDMTELMERLCYMLNLPLTTTPEEMKAELDKLKTMLTNNPAAAAAMIVGLGPHVAALTAQSTPDPAKFVPVAVVTQLQGEVAALTARLDTGDKDRLIQQGLDAGQILPGEHEDWARTLDVAALTAMLGKAPKMAALSAKQTDGKAPPHKIDGGTPPETRWETEWAASAALQAEFGGDKDAYLAFCKAELNGQAKIFGK